MNEALEFLVKHKGRSALIDANLLLTYLVGKTDRRSLSKLKYTKQYEGDFELIERVVESFSVIYTTPNVLTEVSNLGKGLGPRFFQTLGKAVNVLKEEYFDSKTCIKHEQFTSLGLTDAGILQIAAKTLVVTLDFNLYLAARKHGFEAVNLHHLRPLQWEALLPERKTSGFV